MTQDLARKNYDFLLTWVSEIVEGSWREWKAACQELDINPTYAAQDLSALGHIEVDWNNRTFACCPPTAVFLRNSSGCLFITGARPRGALYRMEANIEKYDLSANILPPQPQKNGPFTVLVEIDVCEIEEFCTVNNFVLSFDPAVGLASMLAPLVWKDMTVVDEPSFNMPRRWFNPETRSLEAEGETTTENGLWWYEGFSRSEAWIYKGAIWTSVSIREYGPFLAYPEHNFIGYEAKKCELHVPMTTPLPPLQSRTAVLASGRLPTWDTDPKNKNNIWVYRNISRSTYSLIQESLTIHNESSLTPSTTSTSL